MNKLFLTLSFVCIAATVSAADTRQELLNSEDKKKELFNAIKTNNFLRVEELLKEGVDPNTVFQKEAFKRKAKTYMEEEKELEEQCAKCRFFSLDCLKNYVKGVTLESKKEVYQVRCRISAAFWTPGQKMPYHSYFPWPSYDSVKTSTPLYWAVEQRYPRIVKLLLDRGAEITPIVQEAASRHTYKRVNQEIVTLVSGPLTKGASKQKTGK
jgi:predicted transcriptional regulator